MELPPLPELPSTTSWTLVCSSHAGTAFIVSGPFTPPALYVCLLLPTAMRPSSQVWLPLAGIWPCPETFFDCDNWGRWCHWHWVNGTPGMLLTSYKTQDSPPQQKVLRLRIPAPNILLDSLPGELQLTPLDSAQMSPPVEAFDYQPSPPSDKYCCIFLTFHIQLYFSTSHFSLRFFLSTNMSLRRMGFPPGRHCTLLSFIPRAWVHAWQTGGTHTCQMNELKKHLQRNAKYFWRKQFSSLNHPEISILVLQF